MTASEQQMEILPVSGSTADHCRRLGLAVGDTIFGREEGPSGYWHEARLTLLWAGQEEAMWSVQERSEVRAEWSEPRESGDWCLDCRDWRKVASADHASAHLSPAVSLLLRQAAEAVQLGRDYIAAELAHRQEAYAGYPHKYATEQEDLARVDAAAAALRAAHGERVT